MMVRILAATMIAAGFFGCGGPKLSKDAARQQLEQLMTLYQENRPKFVVQKQEIAQDADCSRATALREAADEKARAAAMSPENTQAVTMVQMELQQAEKACLAK